MPTKETTAVTARTSPPSEFWEDDLEMPLDHVLRTVNDDGFRNEWVEKRTGRQLTVLCNALGVDHAASTRKKRAAIEAGDGSLDPFVLVERFSQFKSKISVIDFAQRVLAKETLQACRIDEENFDKIALLFALFTRKWSDLRLVYHLDKIHKTGFARMKIAGHARKPPKSLDEYLKPPVVKKVLSDFDKARGDGLTSELKDVITHDGRNLVYVRRANRPDHLVKRTGGVIHGYKSEWIILDFEDGGKRVGISSESVDVPLEIANRLASGYFEKECEFENESEVTYAKQLEKLLGEVRDAKDADLALVEIVAMNSPLDGAPKIKISHPDSSSIGGAIGHFEKAVGKITSDMGQIESVKVLYRKKRVSLIFEAVDGAEGEFVVRYSDHRLNALQRRDFEKHMKDIHGIKILSTEKRFKRPA